MSIINVINFYYSLYPVISLHVKMSGGIEGRYHEFTKAEALDFLAGYENEEVVNVDFATHFTFKGNATNKMPIPMLYILYKAE